MKKPKLKTNYDVIANAVLSVYAQGVVQQTTASTYFANGAALAAPVEVALNKLNAAVAETAHPTPSQTAARDAHREELRSALGTLAARLNLDYPGHEAALLSSGLELVEMSGAGNRPDSFTMTNVTLTDAPQTGFLLAKYKRPAGATQTLIRYTLDAALPEEQWAVAVGGARERLLGPFQSGQRVGLKVAPLNSSTTEPDYSDVVWRIVQ